MTRYLGVLILLAIGLSAEAADPVLLKTGREVLASYSSILGISETDPDVAAIYQKDVKRLPQHGQPAELSNNAVLAMTELGGVFCQKAIVREQALPAGQRNLFPDVDFTKGPSQFNSYVAGRMLENLAVNFWQRDINSDESQALANSITALAQGNPDTSAQTLIVAQSMCTIYASSVSFLVK